MFDKHKRLYLSALESSGYRANIEYKEEESSAPRQKRRRPRYRETFWFNPPYNLKVRTPIGREFLKILEKNFPRGNKWYEFFNKHTVKLSYSCTRNIASVISAHNQKLMRTEPEEAGCNCTIDPCPVEEQCLTQGVVYSGTFSTKDHNYTYYGSTGNSFKERYNNHKHDMKNEASAGTTLSNMFWQLKKSPNVKENPTIKWQIIHKCHPLKAGLQEGDKIVKVGKKKITDNESLIAVIQSHEVGDTVKVRVMRGDERHDVKVRLAGFEDPVSEGVGHEAQELRVIEEGDGGARWLVRLGEEPPVQERGERRDNRRAQDRDRPQRRSGDREG